mgnify:CR=1 FL=1
MAAIDQTEGKYDTIREGNFKVIIWKDHSEKVVS